MDTGVPHPDKPGLWLVPPWPADATVHDVVRHFSDFPVWDEQNSAVMRAYYEGYVAAFAAAPTHELVHPMAWRWYEEMRTCLDRCVAHFVGDTVDRGRRAMSADGGAS